MVGKITKALVTLAATTTLATTAYAGGFSRGTADTDILYEDGQFVSRSGITYVSPNIEQTTVGIGALGAANGSGSVAESYIVPSFAMKLQLAESVSCAGTYSTPFGGAVDYTGTVSGFNTDALATTRQEFVTNELAATCAYSFDVGPGSLYLIGGVFMQTLDFEQDVLGGANRLALKDTGYGYRAGIAYEIEEIALRTQLMYRSAVDVDASGTFTQLATGAVINPNAFGRGEFPQSVELKAQTGVAPGWLVFGGVTWTDWSVFDRLQYTAFPAPIASNLNFFYRDGWTVNAGVAHRFNEQLAGSLSVTWDRGVGTGFDTRGGDTWTVAAGGSYTPNENVELRFGMGYSRLEGSAQNFTSDALGNPVAVPNYAVTSDGYAIAGGLSFKVKF